MRPQRAPPRGGRTADLGANRSWAGIVKVAQGVRGRRQPPPPVDGTPPASSAPPVRWPATGAGSAAPQPIRSRRMAAGAARGGAAGWTAPAGAAALWGGRRCSWKLTVCGAEAASSFKPRRPSRPNPRVMSRTGHTARVFSKKPSQLNFWPQCKLMH
jgi:hypothetical protein